MKNTLLVILLASIISACASSHVKEQPKPAETVTAPKQEAPAVKENNQEATSSSASQNTLEVNPLTDPSNILSKRSVYFDFDKYEIKPEFRDLIEAHAKYLNSHPALSVRIEGNADERGSREYNLALGQERAVSVRKALNLLGVSDKQIETVSNGKEKPKASGHDEASWAENRRSDIFYPGE